MAAIRAAVLSGREVAITGGDDGDLRLWDLEHVTRHDRYVRTWDLETLTPLREIPPIGLPTDSVLLLEGPF